MSSAADDVNVRVTVTFGSFAGVAGCPSLKVNVKRFQLGLFSMKYSVMVTGHGMDLINKSLSHSIEPGLNMIFMTLCQEESRKPRSTPFLNFNLKSNSEERRS